MTEHVCHSRNKDLSEAGASVLISGQKGERSMSSDYIGNTPPNWKVPGSATAIRHGLLSNERNEPIIDLCKSLGQSQRN